MRGTRRTFLGAAAGLALSARLPSQETKPAPMAAVKRSGGDLLSRMTWLNEPAHVNYGGGVLNVRSQAWSTRARGYFGHGPARIRQSRLAT